MSFVPPMRALCLGTSGEGTADCWLQWATKIRMQPSQFNADRAWEELLFLKCTTLQMSVQIQIILAKKQCYSSEMTNFKIACWSLPCY